jgi:hypothetical protein
MIIEGSVDLIPHKRNVDYATTFGQTFLDTICIEKAAVIDNKTFVIFAKFDIYIVHTFLLLFEALHYLGINFRIFHVAHLTRFVINTIGKLLPFQ